MKTRVQWMCLCVVSLLGLTCSTTQSYPPPILIPDGRYRKEGYPYKAVTLSNRKASVGIMAIVPTQPNMPTPAAASLAAFARRQYSKAQMKQWRRFYIFVFKDSKAAGVFSRYQAKRKNKPLQNADYIKLKSVWPRTLVRYEYRNQKERVLYPYSNPSGWWRMR